jgi:hypothetical protein
LEYGAKDGPNPHAVVGLVLGAFGELSTSCYSLCTAIARVNAARVLSFWEMPPKQAFVQTENPTILGSHSTTRLGTPHSGPFSFYFYLLFFIIF